MNVELLESVRDVIVFHPQQFCAAQWAFARNARAVIDDGDAPDGFKCCIAGHVLLQSGRYTQRTLLRDGGFHDGTHLWQEAGRVLGLTEAQRDELFFPSQWDKPYKQRYYLCGSDEEAEVAAAYIDYFASKYAASEPVEATASVGGESVREEVTVPT
jgi:hypothetical protein